MFAIESTNSKGWRWISGLVTTRAEAELHLSAIPELEQHVHRIVDVPIKEFPVFVIETNGFEFGGIEFVRQRLHQIEPTGDEDTIHFNVYAFTSNFLSKVPGRDEMGGILHWHITDDTLRSPAAEVFDSILADIATLGVP